MVRDTASVPLRHASGGVSSLRLLLLSCIVLLIAGGAFAGTFDVFGPRLYKRATGEPAGVPATFDVRNPNTTYTLILENSSVSSAVVTLGGAQVFGPSDFNANVTTLSRNVTVAARNTLVVELRGKPDESFLLRVRGVDDAPPVITIASPAEAATVSGSQVTVSGQVSDAISGVSGISCNGTSATVTGEQFTCTVALTAGPNVLSFSAADAAGNVGTASRTVFAGSSAPSVRITEPENLTFVNISPITVRGTVSDPSATLTVGGIATPLANGAFSVQVPLVEGNNNITAVAQNASGVAGVGSVQVTLDTTPPHVTIYSPEDGSSTTEESITISGLVNDIVVGTVNDQQAQVTVNGVAASVANRSFVATSVPLSVGDNVIRATGRDRVGNAYTAQITVRREAVTGAHIETVSGDAQTGAIGSLLPQPLTVRLVNGQGQPVPGQSVVFRVVQSDGTLGDVSGNNAGRSSFAVTSDAQGLARVRYRLGTRAGAGNNRVEATATGFGGTAGFVVSALAGNPTQVNVDAGAGQTGSTGQPLTFPFVVVVTDAGNNRLAHVPVTFRVREGGGSFDGVDTVTSLTDSDGRALAVLTLGAQPGYDNHVVEATALGVARPAVFFASAKVAGTATDTRISGVVIDNSNLPLAGATLRLYRAYQASNSNIPIPIGEPVLSDEQGRFVIAPAPVGAFKLVADGTTIQRPSVAYPTVEYDIVTVSGQDNTVGMPIYLPALDTVNRLCVSSTVGGTLTLPSVPGFSFTVAPGSATFPGGSRTGCITITPVHGDKVPMVPGFGQQPRFVITIQPAGTHFNPPASIQFPNVDGLAPRQVTEMYSYDHDLSAFVAIGSATVSSDGAVIRSDPGVGVLKAGWHCGGNPNPTGTAATCPECRKCDQNGNCVPNTSKDGQQCDQHECKICRSGDCFGITEARVPFDLANVKLRRVTPSTPLTPIQWGRVDAERVEIVIDAICDDQYWSSVLVEVTGDYARQERLLPGVAEVRNTDANNFCKQAEDLSKSSLDPSKQWYMLDAIKAHEGVHLSHLKPQLLEALPTIEERFTGIRIPLSEAKTRRQAIAKIRNLQAFQDAVAETTREYQKEHGKRSDREHDTGVAYDAEHEVTDPVIAAICQMAKDNNWGPCIWCK